MLADDSVIIYLATQDLSTFTNPGFLANFKEKDKVRVFILTFRIIYLVYAFFHGFVAICFWVYLCKK